MTANDSGASGTPPSISDNLIAATESLRRNDQWLEIWAENLICTSCEGFFQTSLLGAFNLLDSEHFADRERRVGFGTTYFPPDLLAIKRTDYQKWWATTDQQARLSLCDALVQAKLVWTPGNASGSATVSNKVRDIVSDAKLLLAVREGCPEADLLLCVVVSGSHPSDEGDDAIQSTNQAVVTGLQGAGITAELHAPIVLHRNYYHPLWARMRPADRRLWSSLNWIRLT